MKLFFDTYDVLMKVMENQYLVNSQCFKNDGESETVTSFLQPPYQNCLK